jgi:hypothetical protein
LPDSEVVQQAQHRKIETDRSNDKKIAFIPEMESAILYYYDHQYNI